MKYRTCVSIAEKTPKKTKEKLKQALRKSDYAEVRFDFLKKEENEYLNNDACDWDTITKFAFREKESVLIKEYRDDVYVQKVHKRPVFKHCRNNKCEDFRAGHLVFYHWCS